MRREDTVSVVKLSGWVVKFDAENDLRGSWVLCVWLEASWSQVKLKRKLTPVGKAAVDVGLWMHRAAHCNLVIREALR